MLVKKQKRIDDNYYIKGMLNNDAEVYRDAIKEFHNSMFRLASAITGEADAEDVVQNAWIQIIRALPKFERRSALKTWILTIVSNGAINQLRKKKRNILFSELSKNTDQDFMDASFDNNNKWRDDISNTKWNLSSPDALLESEELKSIINKTIQSLRPLQQAIIRLREHDGFSIREISKTLGISETNARVASHRARNIIRNAIDQYQHGNNTDFVINTSLEVLQCNYS